LKNIAALLLVVFVVILTACSAGKDTISENRMKENNNQEMDAIPIVPLEGAAEYFDHLPTPSPISFDIMTQDQTTIISTFKSIEQWVNKVVHGKEWYFIEESVFPLMLAELEKHFSNRLANEILKNFWANKDGYYQFLEQESFGNLTVLNNIKVQVQNEENNVKIILSGNDDRGDIEETYILVRNDKNHHYIVSEFSFARLRGNRSS